MKSRSGLPREPQRFHGDVLKRQQELSTIFEKQVNVGTGEIDHHLRVLHFGVRILRSAHLKTEIEARVSDRGIQKRFQLWPQSIYCVFHAELLFHLTFDGRFWGRRRWGGRGHKAVNDKLLTDTD